MINISKVNSNKLLDAVKCVIQYHRDNDSGEGELFGLDFVTTCIEARRAAEDITKVIFRQFPDGDTIALFPDDLWTRGFIGSYMHTGQHGGASPELITELQPAAPEAITELTKELEGLGYNMEIQNNEKF